MVAFWYIIYIAIFIMIVFLLPFSIYFYETDEEKTFVNILDISLCFKFIIDIIVF
jgi:hypothetical protein